MTRDDQHDPGPDERAALELLARMEPVSPSTEAKQRARAAFLRGDAPAMESQAPPRRPRSPRRLLWIPAVAAALTAFLVYGARPTLQWTVSDVVEPSGIVWDAPTAVAGGSFEGGRLELGGGSELGLSLGARLHVRVLEGTRADLPRGPGRWLGRSREIRVESGEIFGSSGEDGLDFTLQLVTPEATALLRGTTFAVFRTGDATCFCLFQGGLEIRAAGSDEILDIEEGQRIFIYRDGREASVEPLDARETMKLQMINDAARGG